MAEESTFPRTRLDRDSCYNVLVHDTDSEWRFRMARELEPELMVDMYDFLPDTAKLPRVYDAAILGTNQAGSLEFHRLVGGFTAKGTKVLIVTWEAGVKIIPAGLARILGATPIFHKEKYSRGSFRHLVAEMLEVPSIDPARRITVGH